MPLPPDDWRSLWQASPDFPLESAFIRFLVTVQEYRRQQVLDLFARHCLQMDNAAQTEARLERLLERLINQRRFVAETPVTPVRPMAQPPSLIHLWGSGRIALEWLGLRRPTVTFDDLLARYVSAQRVYLALETRDLLMRAGHAVELAPALVQLRAGPKFKPDLLMGRRAPQIVQVERRPQIWMPAARARKWQRVMEATAGLMYLVADTAATMRHLQTELRMQRFEWPVILRLTNLQEADQHFAAQGTVWMLRETLR